VSARKKTGYMISAVAQICNVHPQTLRLYERLELVKPSRSDGNTRLYTDTDLRRLKIILNLTRDLGVNLAGVEVILSMRERMERMQREIQQMIQFMRENLAGSGDSWSSAIVRVPSAHIVRREKK